MIGAFLALVPAAFSISVAFIYADDRFVDHFVVTTAWWKKKAAAVNRCRLLEYHSLRCEKSVREAGQNSVAEFRFVVVDQKFTNGFLELALGHPNIVRGNTGSAMRDEAVKPAGLGHRIMQLGIDEVLDCLSQRFGL